MRDLQTKFEEKRIFLRDAVLHDSLVVFELLAGKEESLHIDLNPFLNIDPIIRMHVNVTVIWIKIRFEESM